MTYTDTLDADIRALAGLIREYPAVRRVTFPVPGQIAFMDTMRDWANELAQDIGMDRVEGALMRHLNEGA
jgi:hypothetical protein